MPTVSRLLVRTQLLKSLVASPVWPPQATLFLLCRQNQNPITSLALHTVPLVLSVFLRNGIVAVDSIFEEHIMDASHYGGCNMS